MSDYVLPRKLQPTRLRHPWDFPGNNIGVGCHFLLQCMKVKSESEDAQSCLTLRDLFKFGLGVQNEVGHRLIQFSQENALVIANTLFQQHKRRHYTWTSPDGQHWNQIDYILCNQRWRSSIQSAKRRPGADCGSDHELLIAKFRLKLKKVRKTTRSKYDLNKIPNYHTVEVRNRFKGLDLIESLMNYGQRFMTLYRRQGSRPSPRKRNAKKQNGCLRRAYK